MIYKINNITRFGRDNGTRTHKSLGINEVVDDTLANDVNSLAVISSGNFVRTIVNEIRERGLQNKLRVVNLTNKPLNIPECTEIQIGEKRILRDAQEREGYVAENMQDAGRVKDYTDFRPKAYDEIARKILEIDPAFKIRPNYVSLGVGTGKLFLALTDEIERQSLSTKVVGILPRGENGVFNDDNLEERNGLLYFKQFDPESIADKLVCPWTHFKPDLLKAKERGHILAEVDNDDLYSAYLEAQYWKTVGEISACAGFVIGNPEFRMSHGIREDSFCDTVFTGWGEYDPSKHRRDGKVLRKKPWVHEKVGTESCI